MTHILFLMSDTGGGHRAACRAMIAALEARYPGQFSSELVDVWKDYSFYPLNRSPQTYAQWINTFPASYAAQFWVMDRLFRSSVATTVFNRVLYGQMTRMYREHPADIIVCAHSVFVRPAVYALRRVQPRKPFITVITDYAWPVVLWYDRHVDRCLVPTEPAYRRGLMLGMSPDQMILTGAPVHPKFTHLTLSKQQARAELGWDTRPTARIVLMLGGGDGMGPLVATARAVDARPIDCQLVIIAGRNQELKTALEAVAWQHPTQIYGFVDNMQVLMRAADLVITKAGPGTITEAATVGLPMILSGAIQFQESPNVEYVVEQKAGIYAPGPERVAESTHRLLADSNASLEALAEGSLRLAQPKAIWRIADEIKSFA